MRSFYELHVHRKDGSSRRHVMRGELPKVGDTVPATLAGEKISAKVETVTDPTHTLTDRGQALVEVDADEV